MAHLIQFSPGSLILAIGSILSFLSSADSSPVPAASSSSALPTTAAYYVSGTTTTFASTALTATGTNEGVIIVRETGVAYVNDCTLIKTGDSTDDSESSFTALNAAVGVETYGTIYITDSNITTSGGSANAVHTYEDGSTVHLTNVYIHAEGDGSHGIYTGGGSMDGEDLEIYTYGGHGSSIATDSGGGLIMVEDSSVYTYGALSALVYSTGNITVTTLTGTADIAPAACIDGSNSFTLKDPAITSGTQNNGVFQIVSTSSSSNTDETAYAYVTGGSVAETCGTYGLIFVANIQAYVYLTDVDVTIESGILANITASSDWGTSGSNGGIAYIYLVDLTVEGDIYIDDYSEVYIYLVGSTWTGAINPLDSLGTYSVSLDSSSTWTETTVS